MTLPATGYESKAKSLASVVYPILNQNEDKGEVIRFDDKWGLGKWEKDEMSK